jgi:hypothetical protein
LIATPHSAVVGATRGPARSAWTACPCAGPAIFRGVLERILCRLRARMARFGDICRPQRGLSAHTAGHERHGRPRVSVPDLSLAIIQPWEESGASHRMNGGKLPVV